jgi:hypothetical protein
MRCVTIAVAVCVLSALAVGCGDLPTPPEVGGLKNYFIERDSDIKSLEYSYSYGFGLLGKYKVRVERE